MKANKVVKGKKAKKQAEDESVAGALPAFFFRRLMPASSRSVNCQRQTKDESQAEAEN